MTSDIRRREFLSQATLLSAAFAAPQVFAARSSAAETGAAHSAESSAASEQPLRVGIMGMGTRGMQLAPVFAGQPATEVAYVCCVDSNRMEAGAAAVEKLTGKRPQAVTDFRRILDDQKVDALVIAAPNHWHAPATVLACTAGKHVYCEKPACHNPYEGEMQIVAARKHKRVVQLGTQRRSWPNVREAIEKMQQGAIGKVYLAKGWYANNRPSIGRGQEVPPPEHLDWNLWQGPAPRKAFRDNYVHYNWHWFWHWGNGEVGNNGIHALDVCRWGLGVDFPKRVSSGGGRYFYDDDQETPDSQMVALDFGDKLITWEGRSCQPREIQGNRFGIAFYGTEGTLVIGMGDTTFYDLKDKVVDEKKGKGSEEEHVADFLNAIRTGQKPRAEIETGYRSTLLCLLGAIAHRTGHTLNIDPTNGHIVGDPEAEKLWSREYEPGWEPKV